LTVIVDDLDDAIDAARQAGGNVSREPADQAVGRNVTMSFASGPVIEYVEWNLQTRQAAGLSLHAVSHIRILLRYGSTRLYRGLSSCRRTLPGCSGCLPRRARRLAGGLDRVAGPDHVALVCAAAHARLGCRA